MPPKKAKAPPGAKGDDATELVLRYVKEQNRPYSIVDIVTNLKGAAQKTAVTKALVQLHEEKKIHGKVFGKQWVYVNLQDQTQVPTKEELRDIDSHLMKANSDVQALKAEVSKLQQSLSKMSESLTNDQMMSKIQHLKTENEKLSTRLAGLRLGKPATTAEDRARVESMLLQNVKLWKQRKNMFKEAWGMVSENFASKKAINDALEDMGVETDEAAGVEINSPDFTWLSTNSAPQASRKLVA